MRALCVSIHDVAPANWSQCQQLKEVIDEICPDLPLTLLVVPNYHDTGEAAPTAYLDWLHACLEEGHEVALHGYTHRDQCASAASGVEGVMRRMYTAGEGEFAALSRQEAMQRIARGRLWCAAHALPVRGFVAPAWLLGDGAWAALRDFDFDYTTTLTRFVMLRAGLSVRAPSIVYSPRSPTRRVLSRAWNRALACGAAGVPVLRLGLHPADVRHPAILRHAQRLLGVVQRNRTAMTKATLARHLRTAAQPARALA